MHGERAFGGRIAGHARETRNPHPGTNIVDEAFPFGFHIGQNGEHGVHVAVIIDVKFRGHVWMCKYAIPQLRRRGGGAIVCTSSVQALVCQTWVALYAASKAATVALVKGMSNDHAAEGIRVNAVLPGSVDTPMLRASAAKMTPDNPQASIEAWGRAHPIGRVITADEVAQLVLFLCSANARAITGAAYVIDGGLTAKVPVNLKD